MANGEIDHWSYPRYGVFPQSSSKSINVRTEPNSKDSKKAKNGKAARRLPSFRHRVRRFWVLGLAGWYASRLGGGVDARLHRRPKPRHMKAVMTGGTITSNAPTLPDLLQDGLGIVFVGINPSVFSAQRGHYFARPSNRFWPCLSRSVLSEPARRALSVGTLGPQHDRALLAQGIGFTDVVKRATPKASDVPAAEFAEGIHVLLAKLSRYRPRIACFHGVTGYRHVHRFLVAGDAPITLGLQDLCLGPTRIFLVPNPSGANAHFKPADQTAWYDRLAECLALAPPGSAGVSPAKRR